MSYRPRKKSFAKSKTHKCKRCGATLRKYVVRCKKCSEVQR